MSPLHLPCISATSPLHLPHISPASPPYPRYDVALALWAAALLESICTQMWHQGRCGGSASTALRGWLEDNTFNTLEIATLALLIGMGICTAHDLSASQAEPSEVGVALQSSP